jgi:hypothetical protein
MRQWAFVAVLFSVYAQLVQVAWMWRIDERSFLFIEW